MNNKLKTEIEEIKKEIEESNIEQEELIEEHSLHKPYHSVDIWEIENILQSRLAQIKKDIEMFKEMISDVDIELLFTDIKDKEGEKIKVSDEIMELIGLWWDKKAQELNSQLQEAKEINEKDIENE